MVLAIGGSSASSAFAESNSVTDVFVGEATSGIGQPMPIVINPSDVTMRGDGAIGLGYNYTASGQAEGRLRGRFDYAEHGYMYFLPTDMTTPIGSALASAGF